MNSNQIEKKKTNKIYQMNINQYQIRYKESFFSSPPFCSFCLCDVS